MVLLAGDVTKGQVVALILLCVVLLVYYISDYTPPPTYFSTLNSLQIYIKLFVQMYVFPLFFENLYVYNFYYFMQFALYISI